MLLLVIEKESQMPHVQSTFLRRVIAVDALACAGSGALMAFAAEPLQALTALPLELTRPTGVFLLFWAALLGLAASRPMIPRGLVWTFVGVNVFWVVESAAVLMLGWVQPNAIGYGFVIAQAAAVAVIAVLQFSGLRRAPLVA
jgi:hypothetical protein